jgi:Putative bacterial lipoprotein (DUF799)
MPDAYSSAALSENAFRDAAPHRGAGASVLRRRSGPFFCLKEGKSEGATVVTASAKLVDLKTGDVLWQGRASASSNEGNSGSGGGLIGMLVQAAIKQIANTLMDKSHDIAGITSYRLLHAGPPNGLLYGPRSPKYGTD